jgi:lysophospholipase L1-like esterase
LLTGGETTHFLDINAVFTQADSSLSPEMLPDQLHLTELGYRLWAQAMLPTVDRLLAAPTFEPSLPCLP